MNKILNIYNIINRNKINGQYDKNDIVFYGDNRRDFFLKIKYNDIYWDLRVILMIFKCTYPVVSQ